MAYSENKKNQQTQLAKLERWIFVFLNILDKKAKEEKQSL